MLEYFKNLFTKPAYMVSSWDQMQMAFWVIVILVICVLTFYGIYWLAYNIADKLCKENKNGKI